jgi:hypothetical protein
MRLGIANSYLIESWSILRSFLGAAIVSLIAISVILSIAIKHFLRDTSWSYAISSAVLLAIGTGLWILGTATVLRHNHYR